MTTFPKWSYALSAAHASVQCWVSVPYALHFVFVDKLDIAKGPDPQSYYACSALFMVYIVFDCAAQWRKLGVAYQTHHILTVAATAYNVVYGPHALLMCVLTNELSTVFLSLKALLPKDHVLRPHAYRAFGLTFFVFRILLNFYI